MKKSIIPLILYLSFQKNVINLREENYYFTILNMYHI